MRTGNAPAVPGIVRSSTAPTGAGAMPRAFTIRSYCVRASGGVSSCTGPNSDAASASMTCWICGSTGIAVMSSLPDVS